MKNDVGMGGEEVLGVVVERLTAMGLLGLKDLSALSVTVQLVPRQEVGEVANDDVVYDVKVEAEVTRWEASTEAETRMRRTRRSVRRELMTSEFEWQRSKLL